MFANAWGETAAAHGARGVHGCSINEGHGRHVAEHLLRLGWQQREHGRPERLHGSRLISNLPSVGELEQSIEHCLRRSVGGDTKHLSYLSACLHHLLSDQRINGEPARATAQPPSQVIDSRSAGGADLVVASTPAEAHAEDARLTGKRGQKAWTRADSLFAPTRGNSVQATCDRLARDVWPVTWRAAGARGAAAGQGDGARAHHCRTARGDRYNGQLSRPDFIAAFLLPNRPTNSWPRAPMSA